MSDSHDHAAEKRENYRFVHAITPRWNDIDAYRHINNARYYAFYDTAIMQYLQIEGGFDLLNGPVVPFTIENMCRFHRPLRFDAKIECGLRAGRVGNSSVRYELALFSADQDAVSATGYFVDVFVDRVSERPTPIPDDLRRHLGQLVCE